MHFEYGDKEISCLSRRDKKLGEAIARIGHIDRKTEDDFFPLSSITYWGSKYPRLHKQPFGHGNQFFALYCLSRLMENLRNRSPSSIRLQSMICQLVWTGGGHE